MNIFISLSLQTLQEEVRIPGTDVRLSYLSSRTSGYKSLLRITLTHSTIPFSLMKVHLMVAVEGRLFRKWFSAAPNLSYDFIWDKADVYSQKVYGLSEAFGEWRMKLLCLVSQGCCHSQAQMCFLFTPTSVCGLRVWILPRSDPLGETDSRPAGLRDHCVQLGWLECGQTSCSEYPKWWVSTETWKIFKCSQTHSCLVRSAEVFPLCKLSEMFTACWRGVNFNTAWTGNRCYHITLQYSTLYNADSNLSQFN